MEKPFPPATALADPEGATTHGLFARDIVLPSLGEDPEGYRQIEAEWIAQLQPRNLLERHYVEKIAAASWRLRRLHRWQAQLFEDETLTEDERLDRLDKVLRHETALHRQIDTAVKMLNKDVPQLSKSRARDRALLDTMKIESECRENREDELEVEFEARELLKQTTADPKLDNVLLDATPPLPSDSPIIGGRGAENCQNEPPPPTVLPFLLREGSPLAAGLGSDSPLFTPLPKPCEQGPLAGEGLEVGASSGQGPEVLHPPYSQNARALSRQSDRSSAQPAAISA